MKIVYCTDIEEGVTIALDGVLIKGTGKKIGIGEKKQEAVI
jgi:hypothetical protein